MDYSKLASLLNDPQAQVEIPTILEKWLSSKSQFQVAKGLLLAEHLHEMDAKILHTEFLILKLILLVTKLEESTTEDRGVSNIEKAGILLPLLVKRWWETSDDGELKRDKVEKRREPPATHKKDFPWKKQSALRTELSEEFRNSTSNVSPVFLEKIISLSNTPVTFNEVMTILWDEISATDISRVYKSLCVLEQIVKECNEDVSKKFKENWFFIDELRMVRKTNSTIGQKVDRVLFLLRNQQSQNTATCIQIEHPI